MSKRLTSPGVMPACIAARSTTQSMYANGSLEPLSTSSRESVFSFSARLRERRIENTDAASVDESSAPQSIPSNSGMPSTA